MDDLILYYNKNFTFKKLVLKEMSIFEKLINLIIALIFIGSIYNSVINKNNLISYMLMLLIELILIISVNISVNLVLIRKYNHAKSFENIISIGYESLDKHRIASMKAYLLNQGYNKPTQVEKIIKILSDKEKENKHVGALTKTIFIAGLVSVLGNMIQRCFNKIPSKAILSQACIEQVTFLILFISLMVLVFEATLGKGVNFLLSADSRKYAKITKTLDYIILELHMESNNIS